MKWSFKMVPKLECIIRIIANLGMNMNASNKLTSLCRERSNGFKNFGSNGYVDNAGGNPQWLSLVFVECTIQYCTRWHWVQSIRNFCIVVQNTRQEPNVCSRDIGYTPIPRPSSSNLQWKQQREASLTGGIEKWDSPDPEFLRESPRPSLSLSLFTKDHWNWGSTWAKLR